MRVLGCRLLLVYEATLVDNLHVRAFNHDFEYAAFLDGYSHAGHGHIEADILTIAPLGTGSLDILSLDLPILIVEPIRLVSVATNR